MIAALLQLPALFSSCTLLQSDVNEAHGRQIYIHWNKNTIQPPVDLFSFDTTGAQVLDSYQRVIAQNGGSVHALTGSGPLRLAALTDSDTQPEDWYGIRTYADLCKHRFSLETDSPENPHMAAEILLDDAPARSVTLELTPMLARVRLHSIQADFHRYPYANTPFDNTLLYLGNAVTECLPLGGGGQPAPLSWINSGEPDSSAVLRLPQPRLLLQEGCGPVGNIRIYPQREFYCYPGPDVRLVLAGRVGDDFCYYPVPLPQLQGGQTLDLQITLTRKGSPDPQQPVLPGTVKTETYTVPWKTESPLNITWE